jgi:hypothetical protein
MKGYPFWVTLIVGLLVFHIRYIEFFCDLHGLSPQEYEKVDFGIPSVPMYVCTYMRCWRLNDWTNCIHIRFIHHRSASGQCEYPGSKIKVPSNGLQNTKWPFSWKWLKRFSFNLYNFWRSSPWIKLHRRYLHESNGTHTRGPNTKCHLSKLALPVRRISLLFGFGNQQWSTEQQSISFQGNLVKVNRIWENKCDVFAPIFS